MRTSRKFFTVGRKVVLPFLVLTLLIGGLVSAAAGVEMASAANDQINAVANRDEDGVTTIFASFEQRQLLQLRLMTSTKGLPEALAAANALRLRDQLLPVAANQFPAELRVSVLSVDARELLRMQIDPANSDGCICTTPHTVLPWAQIDHVLAGRGDRLGDKYSGLVREAGISLLYTAGPVVDGGKIVGAVVLAERLPSLLQGLGPSLGVDFALFDPGGGQVAMTPGFPVAPPSLAADQRKIALKTGSKLHLPLTAAHSEELFFVPWRLRSEVVGYAAVVVPADSLVRADLTLQLLIVATSLAALLLVVIVGWYVTRSITRPLERLLLATSEVALGHLSYRAWPESRDEIGRLTESFNEMTASLEDRTLRLAASAEATVLALAAAIEARDPYTHGHSLRVAAYSLILAQAAGVENSGLEIVRRGCLVHDIGKIGVPDGVLGKPGHLDPHELMSMRRHPDVGRQVLRGLDWEPEVFDIVLQHHERWDGGGYPAGLAGERISVLARLVAIADGLDAMTSNRPYRTALSFDEAGRRILQGAGTQFEPAAVSIFQLVEADLRFCWSSLAVNDVHPRPVLLEAAG